jgi:hypothetical protein
MKVPGPDEIHMLLPRVAGLARPGAFSKLNIVVSGFYAKNA